MSYVLKHRYVREGETVPEHIVEGEAMFYVESENEGTAIHIWWFAWDES